MGSFYCMKLALSTACKAIFIVVIVFEWCLKWNDQRKKWTSKYSIPLNFSHTTIVIEFEIDKSIQLTILASCCAQFDSKRYIVFSKTDGREYYFHSIPRRYVSVCCVHCDWASTCNEHNMVRKFNLARIESIDHDLLRSTHRSADRSECRMKQLSPFC